MVFICRSLMMHWLLVLRIVPKICILYPCGTAAHTDTTVKKWGTCIWCNGNGSSSYLKAVAVELDSSFYWNVFANTSDSRTLDFWVNHTSVSSGHSDIFPMPREDGGNHWIYKTYVLLPVVHYSVW